MKRLLVTAFVTLTALGTAYADNEYGNNYDSMHGPSLIQKAGDLMRLPSTAAGKSEERMMTHEYYGGMVEGSDTQAQFGGLVDNLEER